MIRERPNDQRGFIHKKILSLGGTVASLIPGVPSVVGTTLRRLGGSGQTSVTRFAPQRACPPGMSPHFRTGECSVAGGATALQGARQLATSVKFAGGNGDGIQIPSIIPCIWPAHRDEFGRCILGDRPGRDLPSDQPVGDAVMGRYGAGMVPGSMPIDRAICLRGMQLGNDGLCYNKGAISNKQRMWPAGRRPLLSGGEMRAISIAATAGRRLERTTKRLQRIGLMKKPSRAGRRPALPASRSVLIESGPGSVVAG